ncbi:MAG: endonuclease/exonuclease/phosphatase family protein [Oligoflexia bacterium]|nr:endonuclease/exonuclease/phosphatase family protein [Oligoflexia bacterium]
MKISTWNCCLGLTYKKDIISDFLTNHSIDILCIQECEIDPGNASFYSIKGYTTEISNCLPKARTCIYISNKIQYERVKNVQIDIDQEIICIKFCNFLLTNYYRTFKICHTKSHLTHFQRAVEIFNELFQLNQNKQIILLGDFNIDYNKFNDNFYTKNYFLKHLTRSLLNLT